MWSWDNVKVAGDWFPNGVDLRWSWRMWCWKSLHLHDRQSRCSVQPISTFQPLLRWRKFSKAHSGFFADRPKVSFLVTRKSGIWFLSAKWSLKMKTEWSVRRCIHDYRVVPGFTPTLISFSITPSQVSASAQKRGPSRGVHTGLHIRIW